MVPAHFRARALFVLRAAKWSPRMIEYRTDSDAYRPLIKRVATTLVGENALRIACGVKGQWRRRQGPKRLVRTR